MLDEITTIRGPGELIDTIVIEQEITINPKQTEPIEKMKINY